jgi:phosphonatase-like hydrolase
MIKLVVFDLAGTTVHDGDSVASCIRGALAGVGVEPEAPAMKAVMGLPKPEAIRRLLAAAEHPVDEGEVSAIHADFIRRMLLHYSTSPDVREIAGASDAFAVLRRAGVKVALDTGFSRVVTAALMDRLGWRAPEVIDADVSSDEVPRGRPHPDMIRLLMARLGVADAAEVAKVGDTRADLEEGHNAGCGLVIGVTSGAYSREELLRCPQTHVVASVADVPRIVLGAR